MNRSLIEFISQSAEPLTPPNLLAVPASDSTRRFPELAPERPGRTAEGLLEFIRRLEFSTIRGEALPRDSEIAARAGLLQMHDFLEESHQLAQSREGDSTADFWHGIMHRREPDASNSKYWLRRVGRHPVFEPLSKIASSILEKSTAPQAATWSVKIVRDGRWEPIAFVDFCEECRQSNCSPLEEAAKQVQWAEMLLLLRHSLEWSPEP